MLKPNPSPRRRGTARLWIRLSPPRWTLHHASSRAHSTSFRSVAAVVVARSDSDMIHNTAVINLTYLGLALDGIVPGIAWWLTRAFSSFALCAVGGQKQLEKSANHFINAHCSRAKRWQRRRRPPQLPHVATCPTCNFVAQGFIWEAAHHLA